MNIKKICLIIIVICSNITFSGCSDVIDQLANYADKDNKYVVRIKNTVPSGERNRLGRSFDNFFRPQLGSTLMLIPGNRL